MGAIGSIVSGALKYGVKGIAGLAVITGVDSLTGGAVSNWAAKTIQDLAKKGIETQSTEQGRNWNIDSFYTGASTFTGIAGFFYSFFKFLGWDDLAEKIRENFSEVIDDINQQARDFKNSGDVFGENNPLLAGATLGAGVAGLGGGKGIRFVKNKLFGGGGNNPPKGGTSATIKTAGRKAKGVMSTVKGFASKWAGKGAGLLKSVGGKIGKIPGVGKKLAIPFTAAAATLSVLTKDADASENKADAGTRMSHADNGVAPTTGHEAEEGTITVNEAATEVASAGMGILAGRAGAALVAAGSIPVIGNAGAGLWAFGDAAWDTTRHILRGEFSKAGLRAVAGVGETAAGLVAGATGYLTMGTAWREAVREGGAALLGKENTIEHSYAVNIADWATGGKLTSIFGDSASPEKATGTYDHNDVDPRKPVAHVPALALQ